jgi:hypothetical protein
MVLAILEEGSWNVPDQQQYLKSQAYFPKKKKKNSTVIFFFFFFPMKV